MKMTRGEYFLRAKKLREMSRHEPDGIAFAGVQLVMLGALIGVVVLAAAVAEGR
jgi:hypothetical protein